MVSLSNLVVLDTFEEGRFGVDDESIKLIIVLYGFGRGSTGAWNEKLSIQPDFGYGIDFLIASLEICSGRFITFFFFGLTNYYV